MKAFNFFLLEFIDLFISNTREVQLRRWIEIDVFNLHWCVHLFTTNRTKFENMIENRLKLKETREISLDSRNNKLKITQQNTTESKWHEKSCWAWDGLASYDNWSNWTTEKISREIFNNIDWELLRHGFVETRFDISLLSAFATQHDERKNKKNGTIEMCIVFWTGARIRKVWCQLIFFWLAIKLVQCNQASKIQQKNRYFDIFFSSIDLIFFPNDFVSNAIESASLSTCWYVNCSCDRQSARFRKHSKQINQLEFVH